MPEVPLGFAEFLRNITLTGGVAPARAYMEELMPHIDGYRLMNDREALKVLVRP